MNVRCLHCNHSFVHVVPSYARGSATANCPQCGRETPATEDWGADPGGGAAVENRVYCFNCGRAMTARDGELIPVCDECRQEQQQSQPVPVPAAAPSGEESVADWMIRKSNGNVYGPFPTATIVEWIRARKINADEEVAHIGGSWRLFGKHEEFSKFFERGPEAAAAPAASDLDFRRRSPIRDFLRSSGRVVAGVVGMGVIGVGAVYAIRSQALVVPEVAIEAVAEKVQAVAANADTGPKVAIAVDATKLLDELSTRHKGAGGSSTERYLRGRALLLRDNAPNLRAARTELEIAVVLDPKNALALAGLADLYNLLAAEGLESLDLQRQAIYLLGLADTVDNHPAETLRARARFNVASGNREDAKAFAERALQQAPDDAELYWILGQCALGEGGAVGDAARGHFEKALELDAGLHQVWFELARAEERAGLWKEAIEHYSKKLSLDSASAASHGQLGAIFERIGDRARAVAHYDKAVAIDPTARRARLRRALIATQAEGDAKRAAALLAPLWGPSAPEMSPTEKKEAGVHYASALRLSGDPTQALAVADALLVDDPTFTPAMVQRGLALVAAGRPGDAMGAFGKAEGPDWTPAENARIHFLAGEAALQAKQYQDAEDSFRKATEIDGTNMPAWLRLAHVQTVSSDAARASATLLESTRVDPLAYQRAREFGFLYDPQPDHMPLAQALADGALKLGYAPQVDAALGVTLFHANRIDQAKKALGRAAEEDGRAQAPRLYLALIEYQQGNWAAASAHFRALLDLAHDSGVFHAYLGDTLLNLGRFDEAEASFQKAVTYGFDGAWLQSRLAESFVKRDRKEQARAAFDKAMAMDAGAIAPRRARFEAGL